MYPFYLFVAALVIFLLYNYRQVIKDKLGYVDSGAAFTQSVEHLQLELRGTADAIIEQFEQEHQRMQLTLDLAAKRISELEELLQTAEEMQRHVAEKHACPAEQENIDEEKAEAHRRPEDQRIRIVSKMAEQGMDVFEISHATGLGYSEVRLLLNIGRTGPGTGERENG